MLQCVTESFLNSQWQCDCSVDLEGHSEPIKSGGTSSHRQSKGENTGNSANIPTGAGLAFRKHRGCGSKRLGSKSRDTANYMVLGKPAISWEPSSFVVRGGCYQLHEVVTKIRWHDIEMNVKLCGTLNWQLVLKRN